MLQGFGACVATDLHTDGTATAHVEPCKELFGQQICVPGDISSAAYLLLPHFWFLLGASGQKCRDQLHTCRILKGLQRYGCRH